MVFASFPHAWDVKGVQCGVLDCAFTVRACKTFHQLTTLHFSQTDILQKFNCIYHPKLSTYHVDTAQVLGFFSL